MLYVEDKQKMKRLLHWLWHYYIRRRGRRTFTEEEMAVREAPDNILLHKGRLLRWRTPGGKEILQQDNGYIENTNRFLDVIAAHWEGISYIVEAKTGDKRLRKIPFTPVHLHISVLSWMTPAADSKVCVWAAWADTNEPCSRVPDATDWRITVPGDYVLRFGHTHTGDTMLYAGRAWWYNKDGKEIFSWICNHPHVVRVPGKGLCRVDIRYTGGDRPPVEVVL